MLSHQDNELLCRIGPGTPMGELMRRFWMPALLADELEKDGKPVRIRLLGEDLVAYVMLKNGDSLDVNEIKEFCKGKVGIV